MSADEIEIRLQRVAGHARRGWLGDAAQALGVTTRTIQRARSGYLPSSFMKNLEDYERRTGEQGHETLMDRRLRATIIDKRGEKEEEHYLRGLADGFSIAVKELRDRLQDPHAKGLFEKVTRIKDRERPDLFHERAEKPAGSIGSRMIARVAETLREEDDVITTDDLHMHEYADDQRKVDLLVLVAVQKISDALYRNNEDDARRVADAEGERLLREIRRIIRVR